MATRSLEDAFVGMLQDLLHAERQIVKALPKMVKKASHPELKAAFEEHLEVTERQIERLEQVFELLGRSVRARRCAGMEGIIEEAKELMGEQSEPDVLDAVMIAQAQSIEHYEISGYGTCCTWAEQLGNEEAKQLLHETLEEEKETDRRLTEIAKQVVNREAAGVH